jgi:hypothetical protein
VVLAVLTAVTMKTLVFWYVTCGYASIFMAVKTCLHVVRMICDFHTTIRAVPVLCAAQLATI